MLENIVEFFLKMKCFKKYHVMQNSFFKRNQSQATIFFWTQFVENTHVYNQIYNYVYLHLSVCVSATF